MNRNQGAKTPADAERLCELYFGFRLNNSYYVSDNKRLFVAAQDGFCRYCFKRRYLTQFSRESVTALGQQAFELACELDGQNETNPCWRLYSVENRQLLKQFDLAGYESCQHCGVQRETGKTGAKQNYDSLFKAGTGARLDELKQQVFSFGFAEKFYSDNKLGFSNSEFEKILGGNYYARILYRMLTHDDRIIEASCLGLSEDRELATTKAFMEYIERYAFSQQLNPLGTTGFDDKIIDDFLSLYNARVTNSELSRIRSGANWGINLCTGDIHAIPLRFIYNKGDVSLVKPSSSGFAAHVDFRRSLAGSILELVERDAFVRFWHEPFRARNFSINQHSQAEIDTMISVLRLILDNESIVSKCYVVESPVKIPVVMLTISSSDFSKSPSLNFGFGTGFSLDQAVSSALDELRVNVCNMMEGVSSVPGYLKQSFPGRIEEIPDRMNYYSTSVPRGRLGFLDMDNPLTDEIYTESSGNDYLELVERFAQHNLEIYGIDVTPECFRDKNVFVTRAFSPNLYPLQFINENVFNLPAGKLSVKDELPHFFI